MGFFIKIGRHIADAFQTNWGFLSAAIDDLPSERSLIGAELRELVERDLPILIHKRDKYGEPAHERWLADLEAFVTRALRPQLAGRSVIALWSGMALMRALDAMVRDEQALRANAPAAIPVTCRYGSHWAQ